MLALESQFRGFKSTVRGTASIILIPRSLSMCTSINKSRAFKALVGNLAC